MKLLKRGSALNARGWKQGLKELLEKRQRTGRTGARPVPKDAEVVRKKSPKLRSGVGLT
jgi:hypothetical protein